MSNYLKVSVIIPTFNCGDYIAQALDSVLNQTYKNSEIIVVDDGSTDNTRESLSPYIESGRVTYLYQQNKGPGAARNSGIKYASGEYIAFLDADDLWYPTKIEKQIKLLENNPNAGFVYCDALFVDKNRNTMPAGWRKIKLKKGWIVLDIFCDCFILTPAVVMRRNIIDKIGLFNETLQICEDYEYFLRIANKYEAEVVEEKLFERRVVIGSQCRRDVKLPKGYDVLEYFLQNNPDFYIKHKQKVHQRLMNCYIKRAHSNFKNGKNVAAFISLTRSATYGMSLKTLQNAILYFFPYSLLKLLKNTNSKIMELVFSKRKGNNVSM